MVACYRRGICGDETMILHLLGSCVSTPGSGQSGKKRKTGWDLEDFLGFQGCLEENKEADSSLMQDRDV